MDHNENTIEQPQEALAFQMTRRDNGQASITIYLPGEPPIVATDEHPNFVKLRDGAVAETLGADEAKRMYDMSAEADLQFKRVSDRVAVADGRVYFDGDLVHSTLAHQIARFIEAGEDDWKPLVAFMEKLAQNPSDHSREQLYDWLSRRDFTITPDGDFIGYKGVKKDSDGNLVSITAGPAIVNGKAVNGNVPNPLGGVIEIARSEVAFDPAQGCSSGLHVGSYEYAHSFAQGALLKVRVNPRDVVSVPTDCDWQKMRVCRYQVIELIDAPETEPVDWTLAEDDYHEDDFDWDAPEDELEFEGEGDEEGVSFHIVLAVTDEEPEPQPKPPTATAFSTEPTTTGDDEVRGVAI